MNKKVAGWSVDPGARDLALRPGGRRAGARRRATGRRPEKLDVLLLDGQYRQALTCMRLFAKSGLAVGAAAYASESQWAPSFRSRWCSMSSALPEVAEGYDAYVDALLDLLDTVPTTLVLPSHDGTIEALRVRRHEIEARSALPLASDEALAIAISKPKTLALAADLGIATPESVLVTDLCELRDALKLVRLPAVIKPVQSWVRDESGAGTRLSAELVQTDDDAVRSLDKIFTAGGSALVQPWLPGSREAVSLFFVDGRFWGRFAQVSHREWPTLGGVSVLCESIPLLQDITGNSERLVEAMGLEGCSMVEFRRDRDGRPVLMEVNPRMGATVGLAIRAGVDFPSLVWAWGTGGPLKQAGGYRVGQRLRWLTGDMWYVNTVLHEPPNPEVPGPAAAVKTFVADFFTRPSRLDVISLSDPWPGLVEMQATLQLHAWPHARRMLRS